MSKEASNRIELRRKTVSNEESVSDAQKISRATSIVINEPALELIHKPSLTKRIKQNDAREGINTCYNALFSEKLQIKSLIRSQSLKINAIQLASALLANAQLQTANLPALIFLASDARLLTAANGEGLPTDDPQNH